MEKAYRRLVLVTSYRWTLPALLLMSILMASATVRAQADREKLLVAAAPCPPVVIEEKGELTGLGIFLWAKVAAEMGVEYEINQTTLDTLLAAIGSDETLRRAQVGISCLSVTAERERIIDFSHSFHETYTGIAVRDRGVTDMLKNFVTNPAIWRALIIVLTVAALVGGVFFLLEGKLSPKLYSMQTPVGKTVEALMVGILFVTQGPIKFYEFRTLTARILAAVLALSSTFVIASITAILASAFTLESLKSQVTGLQDLANVRVAALDSSTSSAFLRANGIAHQTMQDLDSMMVDLQGGRLDAVVSDAAYLKYTIHEGRKKGHYGSITVLPYEFDSQNYGFALEPNSSIKESVNQALLVVRKSPEWRQKLKEYLGE
jgi:polar amino acid transport system substrate-binding protein